MFWSVVADSFLSFWIKLTAPLLICWSSTSHVLGTSHYFPKLKAFRNCFQRSEKNSDLPYSKSHLQFLSQLQCLTCRTCYGCYDCATCSWWFSAHSSLSCVGTLWSTSSHLTSSLLYSFKYYNMNYAS